MDQLEKRKRICEGETSAGRRGKSPEEGGYAAVKEVAPADEEVEEFFAILRRIQVAVKYFQKRNGNGGRELTASTWRPSFEREDFDGVKKSPLPRNPDGNRNPGLDLNLDPVVSDELVDVSDSV